MLLGSLIIYHNLITINLLHFRNQFCHLKQRVLLDILIFGFSIEKRRISHSISLRRDSISYRLLFANLKVILRLKIPNIHFGFLVWLVDLLHHWLQEELAFPIDSNLGIWVTWNHVVFGHRLLLTFVFASPFSKNLFMIVFYLLTSLCEHFT